MSNFLLNIEFTNEQLGDIERANQNVVVAKPSSTDSAPNVAWQVFSPLQSNELDWQEVYGIYASSSEVVNGAELRQLSAVPLPAAMNRLYTLSSAGSITGPDAGGEENSLALLNEYGRPMTVGLYQDALVNGFAITGNAISAVTVPQANTAIMTPFTTVYLWLQAEVRSNSVVTTVTSPMTPLTFGDGTNEISVTYDTDSGTFLRLS